MVDMDSVANKNVAKPLRKYHSNRSARSKPIEVRVADISLWVKTGSKVAQLRGLAAVLATLDMDTVTIPLTGDTGEMFSTQGFNLSLAYQVNFTPG